MPGEIITQADLVSALGSPTGDNLAIVVTMHKPVERAVRAILRYDPVQAEKTEFYPRDPQIPPDNNAGQPDVVGGQIYFNSFERSSTSLMLGRKPLRSIASIHVDPDGRFGQKSGAFGADPLTAGEDYWFPIEESGISEAAIVYRHAGWPAQPGSVKITYTAGWSASELETGDGSDIYLAVIRGVRYWYQIEKSKRGSSSASGEVIAESFGKYSVRYSDTSSSGGLALPDECMELLQPHVRYGVS